MFIHLAIQYPKPEHADDVLASMNRVESAAHGAPGLVEIGAWRDQHSDRLLGLSVWESAEAFQTSAERIFAPVADDPFDDWCLRPPEVFHLTESS